MPEVSGTFWSWLSAQHLADCWQPEMLRPEYLDLERKLASKSGFAPLREFVDLVASSPTESQPAKWHADSEGIRRRISKQSEPSESANLLTTMPKEAVLVSRQWFHEPSVLYWDESVFRGHGTASARFWVLKSKAGQSVAWLCNELCSRDGMLQLRRASAGSVLPSLSFDALLNVRVRRLTTDQQLEANRNVRNAAKSEISQRHVTALRKPFVLTAQTFEERLDQFEQFLESEGLFSRGDAFFVEPSTSSRDSDLFAVRPTRPGVQSIPSIERLVPQDDAVVNSRWRAWFWNESPAESHRVFNTLASDDELPTHLLMRTGIGAPLYPAVPTPILIPRFGAFREAVLESIQADVGVEDQVWGDVWNELQRSVSSPTSLATNQPDATREPPNTSESNEKELFAWARHAYRPALALKVWRGDAIAGVYLLFGEDQTREYAEVFSKLDDLGIALADILRPQSELVEDATRRESLRRISWVMHQLNGPVGRANSALEDIQEFLSDHPDFAMMLVPNDEKARRRARMPGNPALDRQTLNARLQDARKAVGDVRKIAYQVRMLKRVQGDLPKSPCSLTRLLRDRCSACVEQIPELRVETADVAEISVVANLESIREALDEVLGNACREFRERHVDDPTLVVRCWANDGFAWISVADNALPISIRLISDPFEEDASTYAPLGRGTGLGLAIVHETFRSHGGSCSLTENIAEGDRLPGVTFLASLPLSQNTTA